VKNILTTISLFYMISDLNVMHTNFQQIFTALWLKTVNFCGVKKLEKGDVLVICLLRGPYL